MDQPPGLGPQEALLILLVAVPGTIFWLLGVILLWRDRQRHAHVTLGVLTLCALALGPVFALAYLAFRPDPRPAPLDT